MAKKLASLIIFLLVMMLVGCGEKPPESKAKPAAAPADPKVAAAQKKIDATNPEGKEMIEKLKAMKPEVNEQVSGKTLGEVVDDYTNNKGTFNIKPIGWEASKKGNNTWKLAFHFQDYGNVYHAAEWQYDPETKKLYPFELEQAPTFWTAPAAGNANAKGKK